MPANADQRFFRIKAAQRDLVAMCGGIERAGELTSFGKSHVGRWYNAGEPDLMPVSAVLTLEGECGVPLVTSAMAELNGRRLADPEQAVAAGGNLLMRHADAVGKAAEMMAAGAMAFSDNRLTPAEAVQIDRALSALERAAGDYRKDLAGVRAAGGLAVVDGGACGAEEIQGAGRGRAGA